jgi:anaerobic selenocysteine-containing dehydrogenase
MSARVAPSYFKASLEGKTDEMFLYEMVRNEYKKGGNVSAHLYFNLHMGSDSLYGRSAEWDPAMKRSLDEYLAEAYREGWQIEPSRARPRILFACGGNILRRTRGYHQVLEKFLPKLDLFATLDVRMSTTALYSDYVFPAAGWYEKDDLTWATPIVPYAHVTTRAVEPIAESKSDWEFHCLFLKEVQRRAKERGVKTFVDRSGEERRLDRVYDEFTFQGRFTEDNPEALMRYLFENVTNLGGISWDAIKKKGFERFTELGFDFLNIGNATDIKPNETITANTWHTENKKPWPTLTRRMQFYIDHPFYLELGEQLPVHKDPPPIGGNYPLQLVNQHVRWSIHASWRDVDDLLRLQRGEPLVILSRDDAATREIADGELVRVWNDIGEFEVKAKISDAVRPGIVIANHAWEPYQFRGHRSHEVVVPSPLNPLLLAGGYTHLQPAFTMGASGTCDRDTRIEIERLPIESPRLAESPIAPRRRGGEGAV